jgi:hypothetical protein
MKEKEYGLMIEIKTKVKLTAEEVREAVEHYIGIEINEIQTLIDWS